MRDPTPTPGPDRPSRRRAPRGPAGAWSPPKLVGVAVDGSPSGRDATVLGSLLARGVGAELMLIAVHEEPLLPVDLPGAMRWTAIEEQRGLPWPRRVIHWRPTRGSRFRRMYWSGAGCAAGDDLSSRRRRQYAIAPGIVGSQ